jgi:hypothetical protein
MLTETEQRRESDTGLSSFLFVAKKTITLSMSPLAKLQCYHAFKGYTDDVIGHVEQGMGSNSQSNSSGTLVIDTYLFNCTTIGLERAPTRLL